VHVIEVTSRVEWNGPRYRSPISEIANGHRAIHNSRRNLMDLSHYAFQWHADMQQYEIRKKSLYRSWEGAPMTKGLSTRHGRR